MINLLKLNMLDAPHHIILSQNKNHSIELIKNIISHFDMKIKCIHDGSFNQLEIDDIMKDAHNVSSCDSANASALIPNYSFGSGIYTIMTTGSTTGYTLGNYIPTRFKTPHENGLTIYYNNAYSNESLYDDSYSDYYISVIDNLAKFLLSLRKRDGTYYYYINNRAYKYEEFIELLRKKLGEK